ncbi:MAG: hypothetical protein LBD27_04180, partial [Tannerella sp.]|nr:hypothetical protein [Tannerella sp.]
MKQTRYVPSKESDFYPWAKNLVNVSSEKSTQWNIPDMDTENLNASFTVYETKHLIAANPATRTAV